ncbi:MAG: hypothetical protein LBQ24_05915 [Candidatus Peribacteria bacterium]|jgi:hypothetical protein|nr:hypothetical protein [Candidatus Peribacteria bacterium]
MPSSNTFQEISDSLKLKVSYFLNKLYIFSKVRDVQSDVNNIVTKAEISAQNEMVKRTLAEREAKIAKELRPQQDIRQVKDLTRQDLHSTLIKGRRSEKAKNDANAFTK